MKEKWLELFQLVSTLVAPVVTLILALLGTFSTNTREVKIEKDGKEYFRKQITRSGWVLLCFLLISASLTFSGKYVEKIESERKALLKAKADSLVTAKRDSIMGLVNNNLQASVDLLDAALKIQGTADEIRKSGQESLDHVQALLTPLFPMKVKIGLSHTIKSSDSLFNDIVNFVEESLGENKLLRGENYKIDGALYGQEEVEYKMFNVEWEALEPKATWEIKNPIVKRGYEYVDMLVSSFIELGWQNKETDSEGYVLDFLDLTLSHGQTTTHEAAYSFSFERTERDEIRFFATFYHEDPPTPFTHSGSLNWHNYKDGKLTIRTLPNIVKVRYVHFYTGPEYRSKRIYESYDIKLSTAGLQYEVPISNFRLN